MRSIVTYGAISLLCLSLGLTGCDKKKEAAKAAPKPDEKAATTGGKTTSGGSKAASGMGSGAKAMAAMSEDQQRHYKEFRERGDKAISVMAEMVDIIEANSEDCDKLGAALTDLYQRRKEDIERGKRVLEEASEDERIEWATRQEIEFLPLTNRMVPALQKCQTSPNVTDAFKPFRNPT